jgi:hypothetical protein
MRRRFRLDASNEGILATIEDEPEEVVLMRIRANLWRHRSSVEGNAACDRLLHDL